MARYPALLEPDDGGFNVTFRDIPEAITCGDNREDALEMAAGALLTAMEFYFEDRRPVPLPSSPKDGEVLIPLPASVWAKVLLLNEMLAQRVTPAELARRLDTRPQDITRIVNLGHATKIDTIAAALRTMGKELDLSVSPT
ncbi:type II toxin-antitoxin system HicB family antitoxin [Achromobacter seleniivolatilans]|uniref:Type II toxin-antitoxin system HicB family antitoxin n=1 Tax=Achromobacter seleniivolatilans TaxID=3047478 RepID=A0ABY9M9M1_9BURK|nr:type II toxin-antitoxin system HicB family antitoxin [Achromobacter sp. R39]WMD23284.1 type II toxin-antitoxin system HicB family antitoxin [Achromobacter sp. R39]